MSDKFGFPTDAQLEKINKLAKRALSADEVFVFSGKSAGDMLIPGRYMKLSPEILKVMVDDATKGVSFMLNHNWSNWGGIQAVPFGKVFDGRIENSNDEGETVSMYLDKYIVRDDEIVDGLSANALIKKIETGVLSDTSIGWGTDVMVCSICGMNYYSRDCSHWRGRTYELSDGIKKVCTVTAMPPSIIIPNNNNALFEESIVWDGAYPGAVVTQAKHGDIIETPSGKFTVVDDKEELPENTLFRGFYHNGDIVTMVKKSDKKKVFTVTDTLNTADSMEKGGENMDEKVLKMLETLGIAYKEGETSPVDALSLLAEKWNETVQSIKDSVEPLKPLDGESLTLTDEFLGIPVKEVKELFGAELTVDDIFNLAKEGMDYHKKVSDEALAMGVRAMGNDFPKETWERTFSTMSTKDILNITKTWETQAKADIPAGRLTDPEAGQEKTLSLPDDAFKVGK